MRLKEGTIYRAEVTHVETGHIVTVDFVPDKNQFGGFRFISKIGFNPLFTWEDHEPGIRQALFFDNFSKFTFNRIHVMAKPED